MIFICSNNLSPCFLVSGEIYLYPCDIFVSILGYWLQVAGDQVTCWLPGYWLLVTGLLVTGLLSYLLVTGKLRSKGRLRWDCHRHAMVQRRSALWYLGILSISCKDQPPVVYLVFMYISPWSLMQLVGSCLAACYPAAGSAWIGIQIHKRMYTHEKCRVRACIHTPSRL